MEVIKSTKALSILEAISRSCYFRQEWNHQVVRRSVPTENSKRKTPDNQQRGSLALFLSFQFGIRRTVHQSQVKEITARGSVGTQHDKSQNGNPNFAVVEIYAWVLERYQSDHRDWQENSDRTRNPNSSAREQIIESFETDIGQRASDNVKNTERDHQKRNPVQSLLRSFILSEQASKTDEREQHNEEDRQRHHPRVW
eukprot:520350_1